MVSVPKPGDGISQLCRRYPWKARDHSQDSTRRLSEKAVKVAREFSCIKTVSDITPFSVSDDFDYYKQIRRQRIGIIGAIGSALPQFLLISLDVIKCNMQAKPQKHQSVSLTVRSLLATGGIGSLQRGVTPTLIGYSLHGFVKFGMFDWFQEFFRSNLGSRAAEKHENMIKCVSMASAEFVAVIPLSPLAMVKLKMETSAPGSWPTKFIPAVRKMYTDRAVTGFPFRPTFALWFRQIPISVTQLYLFEPLRSKISTFASAEQRQRWWFGITILSGFGVGVISTAVSQPADYVLSRFTVSSNRGKSGVKIIAEDGLRNALTRGLAPRYVMVSMMTALQFVCYDQLLRAVEWPHGPGGFHGFE